MSSISTNTNEQLINDKTVVNCQKKKLGKYKSGHNISNNNEFQEMSDQLTRHQTFSQITDQNELPLTKRKQSLSSAPNGKYNVVKIEKQTDVTIKKEYSLIPKQQKPFQTLNIILPILLNLSSKIGAKIISQFSRTTTADKYIRLIYSILKLYRAYNPKNNLSKISKQLLNTRRILQWDCKYQLLKEFMTKELSPFDSAYKTLQFSGAMFDFVSFWLSLLSNGSKDLQNISEIMYQWQDDCYFYQCFIELILAIRKLSSLVFMKISKDKNDQKSLQFKHLLTVLRQRKQKMSKKINVLGLIKDKQKSQNQQCIILDRLQDKYLQLQAQIQNLIKGHKISLNLEDRQQNKEILKYSLKTVKYICDSVTSFNNYSYKFYDLNPKTGGTLSILSSVISLFLLWIF